MWQTTGVKLSLACAGAMLCLTAAVPAKAQVLVPGTAHTLVVPYPAGGGSDFTARLVASELGKLTGGTVTVENIGGATGAIAIRKVMAGPTDGKLLYQGSQNELIIPPLTVENLKIAPDDLEIIHPITTTRLVLVVRKDLPVKSLQEFLELAAKSSPSKPLSYGSPGVGSLYHLIPESMGKLTKVAYNHIPYKGSAPLMQDLIGARIDFTVMAFSTAMLSAEKEGQYRIIANLSKDKPKDLGHLPSLSEVPQLQSVDYASNAAYFVRKGTPIKLKSELNKAFQDALAAGVIARQLEADGRRVPAGMSLESAQAFYQSEVDKYRKVIELTGFKPE